MADDSDNGFDFGAFEPSFLEDGYGISGPQGDAEYDNSQEWDTDAWSRDDAAAEDFTGGGGGGLEVATGPFSGGYLTPPVFGVNIITFDEDQFLIQDNGGGEVL